jgi:hypothetical protein
MLDMERWDDALAWLRNATRLDPSKTGKTRSRRIRVECRSLWSEFGCGWVFKCQ